MGTEFIHSEGCTVNDGIYADTKDRPAVEIWEGVDRFADEGGFALSVTLPLDACADIYGYDGADGALLVSLKALFEEYFTDEGYHQNHYEDIGMLEELLKWALCEVEKAKQTRADAGPHGDCCLDFLDTPENPSLMALRD